jgi:hypothetical protein
VTWAKGLSPALIDAVVNVIAEVRQKVINPDRCGTDAKTILALYNRLDKPDPETFRRDLVAVVTWARESADKMAARDIRAEGWADGTDRHRDLGTLCRQDRWAARLEAAQRWTAAPTATAPVVSHADADAARVELARFVDSGAEIVMADKRREVTVKRCLRAIGGRTVWHRRLLTPEAVEAWRAAWPQAVESVTVSLSEVR